MQLLNLLYIVLRLDRMAAKDILGASDQLTLPILDLVRVDIVLLGNLSNSALALQGLQRYLRLECRCVIASFPAGHHLLLVVRNIAEDST